MNRNPFEHDYFIGYINNVTPQYVQVHFPSSVLLKSYTHKGEQLNGGLVGNFVVIEGQQYGFLGKILELSLPEKERLELSEKSFNNKDFHPTGKVEIILSFDLFEPQKIDKGLNSLPSIGAKVFVCSSEFIRRYFRGLGVKKDELLYAPVIELGCLTYDKSAIVEISQQAIFGRHCAVVGTTGGGKSYTVSKLIEGIKDNNGKAILIDPTGEYSTHDGKDYAEKPMILSIDSYFPYSKLTIGDLFVLFRPSGQVQMPILIEAIKSLKIAHCLIRDKSKFTFEENDDIIKFIIGGKNLFIEYCRVFISKGSYNIAPSATIPCYIIKEFLFIFILPSVDCIDYKLQMETVSVKYLCIFSTFSLIAYVAHHLIIAHKILTTFRFRSDMILSDICITCN